MIAPRVPDFRGQVLAMEHVERLLEKVSSALDDAGVRYAIVGGNAVAAWVATVDDGAVRATKDVDVLLRRADLRTASEALAKVGLDQHDVHGVTMFLDRAKPNPKTGAHVVFAGEPVKATSKNASPDVTQSVRSARGFVVVDLLALVMMKLEAYRRIDQVHIEDLLSVGVIDDELAARLPLDLQQRLREIQNTQ